MIKWVLGGLVAVVGILLLYVAMYVGAFREVSWEVGQRGPYHLVYKQERGPYQKNRDG